MGVSNPEKTENRSWQGRQNRRRHRRAYYAKKPEGPFHFLKIIVIILLLEIVVSLIVFAVLRHTSHLDEAGLDRASQTAQLYALAAAAQSEDGKLDQRSTFEPQQATSLIIPDEQWAHVPLTSYKTVSYVSGTAPEETAALALLIDTDGQIIASSYPDRYPSGKAALPLLPQQTQLITTGALSGQQGSIIDRDAEGGRRAVAVTPVKDQNQQVIGAVYVSLPPPVPGHYAIFFFHYWLLSFFAWIPVIILFVKFVFIAFIYRLIRRIRHLTTVGEQIISGQYNQRIQVSRNDDLGHLEHQFNSVAEQFVEIQTNQRLLIEQNARYQERARIARELHDSVKQQVFALSMQIGAALSLLEQQNGTVRQHLLEADIIAYKAQQELTALIKELRPSALQQQQLSSALSEYVTDWNRQNGITIDLHIPEHTTIPPAVEEALLRIAQEALANVARHSKATRVEIQLVGDRAQIYFSLSDNGEGFNPAQRASGVGLASMQERMAALGGNLIVQSARGAGTLIIAQWKDTDQEGKDNANGTANNNSSCG